jgi:hypothetical protein
MNKKARALLLNKHDIFDIKDSPSFQFIEVDVTLSFTFSDKEKNDVSEEWKILKIIKRQERVELGIKLIPKEIVFEAENKQKRKILCLIKEKECSLTRKGIEGRFIFYEGFFAFV